jgi:thioester reductase-like protein
LEHPEIKYVIGLVRAKDEEQARRKVQQTLERQLLVEFE